MNHCMIDIETTGTRPGCKVLQIGAVMFGGPREMFMFEEFSVCIGPGRWPGAANMVEDKSAMEWWDKQDPVVRARVFGGTTTPMIALMRFGDFLSEHKPEQVWCRGASFDFPVLAAAYDAVGLPVPWKYSAEMCQRTALRMAGVEATKGDGSHDAVVDCRQQIKDLWWAWEVLGIGGVA